MGLTIISIQNIGDASKEYVLLQAIKAVNLNNYAVVDTTFDEDGSESNIYRHNKRFPSKQVKAGEYIRLWTKKGDYKLTKSLKHGTRYHNFYFNSDAAIWNDKNVDCAELWKVETVQKKSTKVKMKEVREYLKQNKGKLNGV